MTYQLEPVFQGRTAPSTARDRGARSGQLLPVRIWDLGNSYGIFSFILYVPTRMEAAACFSNTQILEKSVLTPLLGTAGDQITPHFFDQFLILVE